MVRATAVKGFSADNTVDLEHDMNEWMCDPSEHDGIISIGYSTIATPDRYVYEYSALVHYKLKQE